MVGSTTLQHALLGVCFGTLFPLVATPVAALSVGLPLSLASFLEVQTSTPLLWLIDPMPLWLGLLAAFGGYQHGRYEKASVALRRQSEELTARAEEAEGAHLEAEKARLEAEGARSEAEDISRLKSTLLTNMSHELRTPLTGIIGFAAILAEEVAEEHSEFAFLIERNGQRLLDTINSVLDLAQLESHRVTLRPENLVVSDAVAETVGLLVPLARDKGLALRTVGTTAPARLDGGALYRIVTNLVGNAIKFTEAGSVTVETEDDGDHVVLRVRDTGIGIPADFLPHLFDDFRQAEAGAAREHEGNGLGLTITKRLVELMQGSIEAESVEGAGTTITVRLPRELPEAELDDEASVLTAPDPLPLRPSGSSAGTSVPAAAGS